MDIQAVMLRAAATLNWMADTCQHLEQKAELRERSQELLSAQVALVELIKAVDEVSAIYRPQRSIAWSHLFDARASIGGANG